MVIGRITVPSGARRWYTITFPWMKEGELPITFTYYVTTEPGATDELAPTFLVYEYKFDPSKQEVLLLAGGGIDGTVYTVHAHTVSSTGQESEDCIVFEIDNGGC